MTNISFVQDNLPTPDEQLEILKQLLDSRNKDNLYTFNWISNIENLKLRDMLRLDLTTELDSFSVKYNDIKEYIDKTVQNMLRHLSLTLIWQLQDIKNDTVNIFLPTNLPYIIPSQYGQHLYLSGTVKYYFDN